MNRIDIVKIIGETCFNSNIEKGEWSYVKALGRQIEGHKFLDMRFAKDRVSVLVETKSYRKFTEKDQKQLESYVELEKEFTGNNIIAILASTQGDDIKVWKNGIFLNTETKLKSIDEYAELFQARNVNDKESVVQNTYALNEKLHGYGVSEYRRSQFVGTCLLALKEGLTYEKLTTSQIIAGVRDVLERLLKNKVNWQEKLTTLDDVLRSTDISELKPKDLEDILNFIKNKIMPFINDKSNEGQDLLNLFFTAFNKYVGKSDKNQAFSPAHIVHFMCKIANIDRNSRVLDPTCGSGAFLVQAMTGALKNCRNNEEETKVKEKQIFGLEIEEKAFGLATTNMLIHGDGNSNVKKSNCFNEQKWIEEANINVVLMNPPYNAQKKYMPEKYTETWGKDVKIDPSKGFKFVHYISQVVKNGQLLALLPMACAIGTTDEIKKYKKLMLENNTLEAVFTLPPEMFYPGASANACCMVFTLNKPHPSDHKTFFGYYKDDGFIKKKNIGRVDALDKWKDIEEKWIRFYKEKKVIDGLSAMTALDLQGEKEWLCEAYMETDYKQLCHDDFKLAVREHLSFLLKDNKYDIYEKINLLKPDDEIRATDKIEQLDFSKWKLFPIDHIFDIKNGKGIVQADFDNIQDGNIPCIQGGEMNYGMLGYFTDEQIADTRYAHIDEMCLTLARVGSAGCVNFHTSCFIGDKAKALTLKDKYSKFKNKYVYLFLQPILRANKYRYAYGRGVVTEIYEKIHILLPAKNGEPDWGFMEKYIKQLQYADLI